MDNNQYDLLEVLEHIEPSELDYQDWVNVGMALQHEGYGAYVWDDWSKRDPGRYHSGECQRKWNSFSGGSGTVVTGGTMVQMAKDQGWVPERNTGHALDWDDVISTDKDDLVIVDKNWIEAKEVKIPDVWDPAGQIIKYLEILFEASENVGYVTESWEKEGKYLPTKGSCDRTAGQLIELLSKCNGDIGSVLGDCKPEAGAWIRFNPLDGIGVKNENVTDYRYALVESDTMDIDKQNAIIRELELPVACLVHSGGKSLHAIVRVDAPDYNEYRKRVDYLYNVCQKNGIKIDTQNRNPSRLSRMPGVFRNGNKQFLVDTNIGKENWQQWFEWIEGVNDDLPDPESMENVWNDLPELSAPLIKNILRQGHKMLIAGPSKAGKSFALIELCCAIAEGKTWMGWECQQGKIMYVNLELDRASCLHRFKDVYTSLGYMPDHLSNIDIWNLRGKSVPMDKLAPKLIRRAAKKDYIAIIIDPIYKVITGDENSADQMANFCNQFDKICTELGTAVIYCHHHSKGSQGGKRSMDRASGSGVFARDPDALLDLIELDLTDEILMQEENKAVCKACINYLDSHFKWKDDVSQDDMCSSKVMLDYCRDKLDALDFKVLNLRVEQAAKAAKMKTAWRIEGTLREFPKFQPVNLWFDYPVHNIDPSGALGDIQPDVEKPAWKKSFGNKKTPADRQKENLEQVETAYNALAINGKVMVSDFEEYWTLTKNAAKNRIKKCPNFEIQNGEVIKKE
ncbi:AAA family ATPase [Robinsoniella sp. RHS]|uniref:AAA family ATPase n=1 Tax=Robinsoniella sp. RHS TaxID=1504536 RepID=UPI00064A9198